MADSSRGGTDRIIIIIIVLFVILLMAGSGCARKTGDQGHDENAMRIVADVAVFVDYNKDIMMVNMDSIAELSELLKETAMLRLGRLDYRAKAILNQKDFRPMTNEYLLKIRIDDFHGGASKSMDLSYNLIKNGTVLLKDRMRMSTMKGSGKLARVMGMRIVDMADDRIQGRQIMNNNENNRKSKTPKRSSNDEP
jgi:hypothetical protein